ncbi:MAG TPA: hypothetical protein VNJ12_05690 [Candidatus Dormibacteraeota bacterium]|nr:hypothetical protein [Candidatus Dormibacteraeota bacterium]
MPRPARPKNVRVARMRDAKAILDLLATAAEQIPYARQLQDADFATKELPQVAWQCKSRMWFVLDGESSVAGALLLLGNEMRYLVVDEKSRRRGVAGGLVFSAKYRYDTSWAKTKEGNLAMIALLRKKGYQPDHCRSSEGWRAFQWTRKA